MKRASSIVIALALLGAAVWYWRHEPAAPSPAGSGAPGERKVLYWHDPMVPNQRFDKPGKSPFMDMDLVPKYADEDEGAPGVAVSSAVRQSLGIRLASVERKSLSTSVDAVALVRADERRLNVVQTRVGGFVERLYVRAQGEPVRAGQKLADIYAPDLYSAQAELLALARVTDLRDIARLRDAARERLHLLGMAGSEVTRMEREGKPTLRIGIYAPISGVVQELGVREGAAVMSGATLFELADLARLWLVAEISEPELGRVPVGAQVVAKVSAYPGRSWDGKVDYVYPDLNLATRTVKVRMELANPAGELKPGMLADVHIRSQPREALVVPTETIIATGRRKLAIVGEEGRFRPAEIETGIESEGLTEVLSGLAEGEKVVVSGQFLIDSEASLRNTLARLATVPNAVTAPDPHAGHVHGTGQ
jgi:Cu(I)/Ag(I) efflux system membrane fusion protein